MDVHLTWHHDPLSDQVVLLEEVLPVNPDATIPGAIHTSSSSRAQHELGTHSPLTTLKKRPFDSYVHRFLLLPFRLSNHQMMGEIYDNDLTSIIDIYFYETLYSYSNFQPLRSTL